MGQIIATRCRKCGFENVFRLGGNRSNHKTFSPAPAINKETGEFEEVNYIENKNNSKYTFYSDDSLKGDNIGSNRILTYSVDLNEEGNFCPKCKEFAFAFRTRLLTD